MPSAKEVNRAVFSEWFGKRLALLKEMSERAQNTDAHALDNKTATSPSILMEEYREAEKRAEQRIAKEPN